MIKKTKYRKYLHTWEDMEKDFDIFPGLYVSRYSLVKYKQFFYLSYVYKYSSLPRILDGGGFELFRIKSIKYIEYFKTNTEFINTFPNKYSCIMDGTSHKDFMEMIEEYRNADDWFILPRDEKTGNPDLSLFIKISNEIKENKLKRRKAIKRFIHIKWLKIKKFLMFK